jgi:hypothetical protein
MTIDYSGFAFPKGRVRALVKEEHAAKVRTTDEKENAKARKRAKKQCEVQEMVKGAPARVPSVRAKGHPDGIT